MHSTSQDGIFIMLNNQSITLTSLESLLFLINQAAISRDKRVIKVNLNFYPINTESFNVL